MADSLRDRIQKFILENYLFTGDTSALGLDDSLLGFNVFERLAVGSWAFVTYLYKLVFPFPMSPLYPYPKEMPWHTFLAIPVFFGAAAGWFCAVANHVMNRHAANKVRFFIENIF